MTFNMKMIEEHVPKYMKLYKEQFGETTKGWFSALRWLTTIASATGSFESDGVNRVKEIIGVI